MPAVKSKHQSHCEEYDKLEKDPYYIQKQVDEGTQSIRIPSFNINLPVFTLNPNKRVKGRALHLSAKQEQARLNRLKQIYANKGMCPNFLFMREDHCPGSLCSMEPLLIQINEEGQLKDVEGLGADQNQV